MLGFKKRKDTSDKGVSKLEEKKNLFSKIDFKDKKTRKLIKRSIIIAVVILSLVIVGVMASKMLSKGDGEQKKAIATATAARGELEVTLTGSGVIEAMDQYDIVPLVRGSILTAPFEEGEIVEKDALLYTFDASDAQINIQKAQNSIQKANISMNNNEKTLKDWVTYAPVEGYVSGLDIKIGDTVNANTQICTITNDDMLKILIPFSSSVIDNIYVGASAQLTSAQYMTSNIYGTVSDIDKTPIRQSSGGVVYNVEITLDNPGALSVGTSLTAKVGEYISSGAGETEASEMEKVLTKASGKVVNIYCKNGDKLSSGAKIIEIKNDDTLDSITRSNIEYSDLQLSLQSQYDALDDYTITSPIKGTVIKKDYKAGDTVGSGTNSTVLATIADISSMKFTMDVDELDITKIKIGQSVDVEADALEGEVFVGRITQIIQEGESTNGVTTYPVEVVIDEPGNLMIGMNVTATVVIEHKEDVLKVPIDAVSVAGGKSYVQVLKSDKKPSADSAQKPEDIPENMPEGMPENMDGNMKMPDRDKKGNKEAAVGYTLEDFERVEVSIGINNEDEIEILDGLKEGDIVYVNEQVIQDDSIGAMMGQMHSQMMGGGMGGGMPSGGGMPAGGPPSGGGMPGGR